MCIIDDPMMREKFREAGVVLSMSQSSIRPVVAFMTDFGLGDGDVGVMKGVVLGITPEAQIVDITHDVAPQNVPSGAWILAASYRYFPKGTVFVCVVDPGVGSTRRPIAVRAGDWVFVGPDNGLFSYVLAEQTFHEAVTLANPAYRLSQVSSTFHGRDIFAPAGAHLAGGVAFADLGDRLELADLVRIDPALAARQGERIEAEVLHIDNFGNIITNIPLSLVPDLFSSRGVRLSFPALNQAVAERRRFFADVPEGDGQEARPFIYGDSSGYVGIAIRDGNAARALQVKYGEKIIGTIENA
jgi:S-adenosylmethionine hydrolase